MAGLMNFGGELEVRLNSGRYSVLVAVLVALTSFGNVALSYVVDAIT